MTTFTLADDATLLHEPDQPVRLVLGGDRASNAPLVECFTLESGRGFVDNRLSQSALGAALRPIEDWVRPIDDAPVGWRGWEVRQRDDATGVGVVTRLLNPVGTAALRIRSTVTNEGTAPVHLTAVSLASATLDGIAPEDADVIVGRSGWMSEGRWRREPLARDLPDVGTGLHGQSSRDCFRLASESGWSSSRWAPVGFVEAPGGRCVGWQIEHNGAWTIELSRRTDALALVAYGPTDLQHHWLKRLAPGDRFETPAAAIVWSGRGWQTAVRELTGYRRALRTASGNARPVAPIVFNDYLNTVMANPSTAKLRPLIGAAASAGAEVFCIDAGWFDDDPSRDWWDSVGAWQPSTTRFEGGIDGILGEIRDHGLIPGLWIEPLAVGLNSPTLDRLGPAVMRRAGVPIVEQSRHRLDMRHPLAQEFLDEVVDRMVGYGIGYLKIDDNFSAGSGPDADAASPGDGLLEHQRAWAGWLARLGHRHPDLIVENCASGGMTTDYGLLAHTQLQSTSDQQDMAKYPTIAAAAPMVVLPEQAGNWGVPASDMTLGEVTSTLATSLSGSLYLSGKLHELSEEQARLVSAATALARQERDRLPHRLPVWPLGLPGWTDEWVALILADADPNQGGLLFVWHRAQSTSGDSTVRVTTNFDGHWSLGEQLFPPREIIDVEWDVQHDEDFVSLTTSASSTSARIYRIRPEIHLHGVSDAA